MSSHPAAPKPAARPSPANRALQLAVRAYQVGISPSLPASCRFTPTCSQYALSALQQHGALAGSYLAAARIARCHPWCAGGPDEVPATVEPPAFLRRLLRR